MKIWEYEKHATCRPKKKAKMTEIQKKSVSGENEVQKVESFSVQIKSPEIPAKSQQKSKIARDKSPQQKAQQN